MTSVATDKQDCTGRVYAAAQLPSALECLDDIVPGDTQEPALFLDFDGTLAPIAPYPDAAQMSASMRAVLQRLAGLCDVAIISGRNLADVRERVGIDSLWYAGSHGFDIAAPGGERTQYGEGIDYLPVLDAAQQLLGARLETITGCRVERKRFAIAVHYRQVADAEVATLRRVVAQTRSACPGLRMTEGRKIFELQPDVDWDKGKALRWLMQTLDMDPARFVPVYIGDDITDEDAFRELQADGVGILVGETAKPTRARCRLDDPAAVEQFLHRLGDELQRRLA